MTAIVIVWIVIAALAVLSLVLITRDAIREFDAHTAGAIDLALQGREDDEPSATVHDFKPRGGAR